MNEKKQKLLEIRTNKLVDSLFVGNYKTNIKGNGIEFVDYKEYDFSDNIKNIDFLRSEREGKTLVKIFEEERDLAVYFIVELNDTFLEKYNTTTTKLDIVYDFFYLIGLSAIKNGDKIGLYIFNNLFKQISFAKKGKQNFVDLLSIIDKFEKNNFKIGKNNDLSGLNYFNTLKIKKSVVFYLTDNLDIDEKQLKLLGLKNDLILCNIFSSFENNLDLKGVTNFGNHDFFISTDLDKKKLVSEYKKLRQEKILKLKKNVLKIKGRYIFLDETKNTYKEITKLFKK